VRTAMWNSLLRENLVTRLIQGWFECGSQTVEVQPAGVWVGDDGRSTFSSSHYDKHCITFSLSSSWYLALYLGNTALYLNSNTNTKAQSTPPTSVSGVN